MTDGTDKPVAAGGIATGSRVSHIHSHTALRGVAAILVVLYHLQFGTQHRLAFERAVPLLERCYLLVDLFFILSGFIISLTGRAARDGTMRMGDVRAFYAARIARVYPLHVFCLGYAVMFGLIQAGVFRIVKGRGSLDWDQAASFFQELLLIQSWIPGAPYWNVPSWSISAEIFAYALFPFLVNVRRRSPTLAFALLLVIPTGFYGYVALGSGSLDILTGLSPIRCLSGFALGMLVFYGRSLSSRVTAGWLAAAQVVGVAGALAVLASRSNDVVIIPFFVLIVAATWQDRGPLANLLSAGALRRGGELSYSVYLNHVPLITIMSVFWGRLTPLLPVQADVLRILQIAVYLTVIILVSRWTYRKIEVPARNRLYQRLLPGAPRVRGTIPIAP